MEYAKRCALILKKVKEPVELDYYLQKLSVKTGFSQDVLMQQIGVKASTLSQNRVNALPEQKRTYDNSEGGPSVPEKTLLAIMASGNVSNTVIQPDDFNDERLKTWSSLLINGRHPADILDGCETEQERSLASEIFAMNNEINSGNADAIAEDCLLAIRRGRIIKKMDEIHLRISSMDKEEKEKALRELVLLSNEAARLKAAAQRKEHLI